jgi:hypothetical protein
MQKQEPGKSNLKFLDLRVTEVNSMSRKQGSLSSRSADRGHPIYFCGLA